jgi:hypothetical protein
VVCGGAGVATPAASARSSDRPNIVLVLTDDQHWDTLRAMPTVEQALGARRHVQEQLRRQLALLPQPHE